MATKDRKTIFDLENKLDIKEEFLRICGIVFNKSYRVTLEKQVSSFSYIDTIDRIFFTYWPYRDTSLNSREYLKRFGIDSSMITYGHNLNPTKFLYFLEFILNISAFFQKKCREKGIVIKYDNRIQACLDNIKIILPKMNCDIKIRGDKTIIIKKNIDIDYVIDIIPEDIGDLLLQYCDFRNEKDIEAKKSVLKKIDLYIDANKAKFDKYDGGKSLRSDIDFILNKMGVNHKTDATFKNISDDKILNYYDDAFSLMLELIRQEKISNIRKSIKMLKSEAAAARKDRTT